MSWSKTRGEVHEETLTWSVDSLVKVDRKQTAWAALVVHEENLDVDFEVTCHLFIVKQRTKELLDSTQTDTHTHTIRIQRSHWMLTKIYSCPQ